MSRFVYTEEMIEYVKEIAPNRFNREIAELFNKKFGLNKTVSQINSMKSNHKITSGNVMQRKRPDLRLFSKEQERFVKENVKGNYNKELAEMVNERFETSFTVEQIKALKKRRNWSSDITGYFEKNHETWNKGMKGLQLGGDAGWFEKGQTPHNYRPVGSKRICKNDGYVIVKVQDDGTWDERWKHKHVVIWEKHNGKVPKNHVITFLDGDKTNTNIENLTIISRRTLSYLNKNDGLSNDPDENIVRIALAKLDAKSSRLELTKGDDERYKYYLKLALINGIRKETFKARLRSGWCIKEASTTRLREGKSNV